MDDHRTTQALRELAAMYLSAPGDASDRRGDADAPSPADGAEGDRPDGEADREQPDAELLIVGHLPGPANLWANQYAQRRAHDLGREVAVARLASGRLTLDWFALDPAAAAAGDGPHVAELDAAAEAVGALRQRGCLWIIALNEPIDDAVMPLLARLHDWTLLSGADEAAVVAGYRLLKQWVDLARRAGADADQLRVRLALLGCPPDEADRAVDKIQRAAARFLTLAPRPGAHQQRMNPVHRRTVGRFDLDADALAALADLSPLSPTPDLQLAGQGPFDETADRAEATPSPEDLASAHAIWDQLMAAEAEPHAGASGESACAGGAAAANGNAADQPAAEDPPAGAALADYIPAVSALRARCPRHEEVDLAVDGEGRLHLLLWSGRAADPVRALWETAQWAIEHARLIALTAVERPVQPDLPPTVHLFTDEPKAYLSLAQRDALRLHALTPHPDNPDAPPVHLELN